MWGIVPAAGRGSRIQPLAFSKELLPVGSRSREGGDRPCAVSEYLVERLVQGGADKICFVISPGKSDIMEYFGAAYGPASLAYTVQPRPSGLCDAIFRAAPLIGAHETVAVGLPDTVWFPETALRELPDDRLSFLLFPVQHPEFFDAVAMRPDGAVIEIQVKSTTAATHWIWGAFKMPACVFRELEDLWRARQQRDEYVGTLVNAYLGAGGSAVGAKKSPESWERPLPSAEVDHKVVHDIVIEAHIEDRIDNSYSSPIKKIPYNLPRADVVSELANGIMAYSKIPKR